MFRGSVSVGVKRGVNRGMWLVIGGRVNITRPVCLCFLSILVPLIPIINRLSNMSGIFDVKKQVMPHQITLFYSISLMLLAGASTSYFLLNGWKWKWGYSWPFMVHITTTNGTLRSISSVFLWLCGKLMFYTLSFNSFCSGSGYGLVRSGLDWRWFGRFGRFWPIGLVWLTRSVHWWRNHRSALVWLSALPLPEALSALDFKPVYINKYMSFEPTWGCVFLLCYQTYYFMLEPMAAVSPRFLNSRNPELHYSNFHTNTHNYKICSFLNNSSSTYYVIPTAMRLHFPFSPFSSLFIGRTSQFQFISFWPTNVQLIFLPEFLLSLSTANAFSHRPDGMRLATYGHIAAWISQFIGHGIFEGRAPAILDNVAGGKSHLRPYPYSTIQLTPIINSSCARSLFRPSWTPLYIWVSQGSSKGAYKLCWPRNCKGKESRSGQEARIREEGSLSLDLSPKVVINDLMRDIGNMEDMYSVEQWRGARWTLKFGKSSCKVVIWYNAIRPSSIIALLYTNP